MKLIWGKDYSFGSEIILFPLRMENSSESFTKTALHSSQGEVQYKYTKTTKQTTSEIHGTTNTVELIILIILTIYTKFFIIK